MLHWKQLFISLVWLSAQVKQHSYGSFQAWKSPPKAGYTLMVCSAPADVLHLVSSPSPIFAALSNC